MNVNLEQLFYYHLDDNKRGHLKYILKKLGFSNEKITENYLKGLYAAVFHEYKNGKFTSDGYFFNLSEPQYANYTYGRVCYEYLFKKGRVTPEVYQSPEIDYRWIRDFIIKNPKLDYVTASDISSYVFCPASYCIKKCFSEVEKNEEAHIGTELHENNRLVSLVEGSKNKFIVTVGSEGHSLCTALNKEFFDDVRSSTILYVGHDDSSEKYFVSSKDGFFGQPDYVFTNRQGENFIVEEKFRSIKRKFGH